MKNRNFYSGVIFFTICLIIIESASAFPTTNGLVAYYQFNGNNVDTAIYSNPISLNNTEFVNNSLYLNGIYDLDYPNGYTAKANIKDFNYNTFTINLDFYPIDHTYIGSNNSTYYAILVGGEWYRWFGLESINDTLVLSLNNFNFRHTFNSTYLSLKLDVQVFSY